jgi:hypothetical protein
MPYFTLLLFPTFDINAWCTTRHKIHIFNSPRDYNECGSHHYQTFPSNLMQPTNERPSHVDADIQESGWVTKATASPALNSTLETRCDTIPN